MFLFSLSPSLDVINASSCSPRMAASIFFLNPCQLFANSASSPSRAERWKRRFQDWNFANATARELLRGVFTFHGEYRRANNERVSCAGAERSRCAANTDEFDENIDRSVRPWKISIFPRVIPLRIVARYHQVCVARVCAISVDNPSRETIFSFFFLPFNFEEKGERKMWNESFESSLRENFERIDQIRFGNLSNLIFLFFDMKRYLFFFFVCLFVLPYPSVY